MRDISDVVMNYSKRKSKRRSRLKHISFQTVCCQIKFQGIHGGTMLLEHEQVRIKRRLGKAWPKCNVASCEYYNQNSNSKHG